MEEENFAFSCGGHQGERHAEADNRFRRDNQAFQKSRNSRLGATNKMDQPAIDEREPPS